MRKNILILAIILSLGGFSSVAYAQIMLEEGKIIIRANPGETIVNVLPVHNMSTTNTVNLRAYWEDFNYVEPFDGTKDFTPSGTSERSASRWVNFSPQQFSLEAKGSKKISYSIQVPTDAKGGYYGVLFFEEGTGQAEGQVGVSIVTRVGALFFIETTTSSRKGKVENLKFEENHFSGDFVNLGDVILIPDSTYYLMNDEGIVAYRGEIKKFYLAAGKAANFQVPVSKELASGKYTAVLTFDFGNGENETQEFDFRKTSDGSISIEKVVP
ncbi:MAG: hypothetical protein H6754_04205 [Candidatus Omnitrophica bacterium]|nr:hypothetical protein [Candidatus Omnitrophota bacterium]